MEIMSFFTGAFIGAGVMFVTMLLRRPRLEDDHHFHHHLWLYHDRDDEDDDPANAWKHGPEPDDDEA